MHYRPEIDGLRCIAVLSVIFHHAGIPHISGGFLGVDVFFVISGFLITRIILGEIEAGTFSLMRFYERRFRRILPAVVFVLFCTLPFAWALMVPFQFHEFSRSMLSTLLFISNVFFWRNSSYFDAASEHKPLLHTWSLAVEEHFYLLFPVLLLVFWPFGRTRVLVVVIVLTTVSLLIAEFTPQKYATASFFLLPTRAWEIGAGCILAFFPAIGARMSLCLRDIVAALGLIAVLASFLVLNEKMALPGLLSCLPVMGTVLVIAFASQGTHTARLLSLKWIVAVGTVSFSLYLWHQPVFVFSRLYFGSIDGWMMSITLVCVIAVLSILSYRFIELPFRHSGKYRTSFQTVAKFVLGFYALLLVNSVFAFYEERNSRFLFVDYAGHPALFDAQVENARREEWQNDPVNLAAYMNTEELPGARVMVLGDSHSTDFYNMLQSQRHNVGDIFAVRVPLFDGCMSAEDMLMAEQETRRCISRYLDLEARDLFEPATHVVFSLLWTKFSDNPQLLRVMIMAAVDEVQKRGRVAVVSPGAYHSEPMLPFVLWKLFQQGELEKPIADAKAFDVMRDDVLEINRYLEAAARAAGAEVFDRLEIMCSIPLKRCHALTPDGHSVYTDGHHTTVEGATFFGELARVRGKLDVFSHKR